MDAGDLRFFEAVARLGGMNRAAVELHTVQSNVTARIRQLEADLGVPLFRRHARGVSMTAAGHRLLPYAERMHQLLAVARRAVVDDGAPQGTLTVGSLETTAALRLSPSLAAFVTAHPTVDVCLRTGTSAELVEAVVAQRLEGAFVCGPVRHPDLVVEPMFTEELVLLTAPAIATPEALLELPDPRILVLRAGCSYRQRLEDLLARQGIQTLRRLEFGTLEAIFAGVAAGLGVTLLPRALVGAVWEAGRVAVHRLPAADAEVETLFIRRRDGFLSSALGVFLDRLRTDARAFGDQPAADAGRRAAE